MAHAATMLGNLRHWLNEVTELKLTPEKKFSEDGITLQWFW
jgi:hypothetical protein